MGVLVFVSHFCPSGFCFLPWFGSTTAGIGEEFNKLEQFHIHSGSQ